MAAVGPAPFGGAAVVVAALAEAAAAAAEASPVAAEVSVAAVPEENGNVMSLWFTPPKIDHSRVTAAIQAAEQRTSGEIRVLLARHAADDPVATAQKHFERMGMTKTALRNGVLIFLAPRSRTFAMIGDTAIHEKCGAEFWTVLTTAMTTHFQRDDFTGGLVHGIERAGELLAQHFPRQNDDRNELSDQIEEV